MTLPSRPTNVPPIFHTPGHQALAQAIRTHDLQFIVLSCGERQALNHPDHAYRLYLDALYAGDDICFENHDGSVILRDHDL